ncbi:MAG TPA: hypothetical protein VNT51_10985 [Miltoncostaeaceae bacterium]|nr:hypothetical protein [Miltoncostaeaceae bacterium]
MDANDAQRRSEDEQRTPGVPPHEPDLARRQRASEQPADQDVADEASEESFPASDPPAPGGPGV